MSKKILLALMTIVAVVGGVAALSAYEAHVINVTAHIENALDVDTYEITFGTVFPQEYVKEEFTVRLSDSFVEAGRVDDIDYVIKQKPKCVCDYWGEANQEEMCTEGRYAPVDYATHLCPTNYSVMLDLCPFLSKLPLDQEKGDYGVASYFQGDHCTPVPAEPQHATGRLTKIGTDTSDTWAVDLKVPPVDGFIGQDWPESCAEWVVPENEKDYGCDLWIEVTGISLTKEPFCGNGIKEGAEECDDGNNEDGDGCSANCTIEGICVAKPDVMQVLDRSGSIDSGELITLKTAALAFVTALNPQPDGAHMGQSSFSTTGSLDLHLTSNKVAIDGAINALTSGGYTNLSEGISLADGELDNPGDNHDREDVGSPDYMVIITDGQPNRPIDVATAKAAAIVAANAADADGIIIYVVGVGTTSETAAWLKDNIATTPGHYFDATNWADLEAILVALACPTP